MNLIQFNKIFTPLGIIFEKSVSKELVKIYYELLKGYSDEQIDRALNITAKTCKFFPKPAEIIETIEGNQSEKSLLAWEKVKRGIEEAGVYQSVIFDDLVIHKVIDSLGGWISIFEIEGDLTWYQKDFERLYQAYNNKPQLLQNTPKKLLGLIEIENRNSNYLEDIPEAILIGDIKLGKAKTLVSPER